MFYNAIVPVCIGFRCEMNFFKICTAVKVIYREMIKEKGSKIMKLHNILTALLLTVAIAFVIPLGCAADDDDDDTTAIGDDDDDTADDDDDDDISPVTDGAWYKPGLSTTWQWQLLEEVNTSYDVDVYDIDLFDNDAQIITDLQDLGIKVICYFSAGSSEDWRNDFSLFADDDMGTDLDGWEGERWLDIRSENVFQIMLDRLDVAVEKGCDGVEPDNMDGFTNDTGFDLSAADQLAYNRNLANEAHERGLTVGLKNDGDQATELVEYFDFSLNEECHQYGECDQLQPFLDAGKPVFNAEYADDETAALEMAESVCPDALDEDIRTLIMPWDLDDSFRISCDEQE
jgi:endo-alpha-1,4-polygalactosaminidase (GH114 family)